MINNLDEFVDSIEDFDALSWERKSDLFMYYKTEYEKYDDKFSVMDIYKCFRHLQIPPPPYGDIDAYLKSQTAPKTRYFTDSRTKTIVPPELIREGQHYYSLSRQSKKELKAKVREDKPHIEVEETLQSLIPLMTNEHEKEFLRETISCFDVKAYRAVIVMMWTLTMEHIYQYILSDEERKAAFNDVAGAKVKINHVEDFSDLLEWRTIEICGAADIISKNVYITMKAKLTTRNTIAHASTVSIHPSKAHDFIMDLVNNVILKVKNGEHE